MPGALYLLSVGVDPRLPSLPDTFDTWVTCNIANKNYTVVVHEIFDAANSRALLSRWHGGTAQAGRHRQDPDSGLTRTLYLFDIGEYFHVNSTACVGGQLDNLPYGPFAHAQRTPTSKEMFDFARDGQTETYMGTELVQGIPCNHWQSVQSMGSGGSMTLDYFFSVPEWANPEGNATEVPVLLHLTGSSPSRYRPNETHSFDHYYAFNHFRTGPIRGWSENQFYISAAPCVGNITTQPEWATLGNHQEFCEANCGDMDHHDHGGVYFGFVVLGAVCAMVVVVATSFVCGRKYGEQFKPMVNEAGPKVMAGEGRGEGKAAMEITAAATHSGPPADPRVV